MHSFVFRFSNPAHSLWFPQVGQEVRLETAPLVVSGCCHDSFSIYLLVTYLSAILHTCLSSTCCIPRRTTTAHKISVYCACKKRIRHILLTSRACYKSVHIIKFISLLPHFASHCNTGRARMAMEGEDEEGKSVVAKSMGESPCVTCANMDLVGHLLYSCVTHVTQI